MGKGLNKMLEIIGVSKEDEDDFDNTFEDEEEEDEDIQEQDGITVTTNRYPRSSGSSSQTASSSRYARRESNREDVSMNTHDYNQTDDIYEARRKRSRLSSIQGGANSHTMLIHSPATYTESQELVLQLKQNKQIIIKLDSIEKEIAQRILDFMSGAAFALEAQVTKISKGIYLFTSTDTKIEKPERDKEQEPSTDGFLVLDENDRYRQ